MTRWMAIVATLAACAPASTIKDVREVPVPADFAGSPPGPSLGEVDWRTFFADDNLRRLVSEALSGSFDVRIALQRIEVARAAASQAGGARLPSVALGTSAAVRKYGLYTMDGAGNASTDITPGRRVPEHLPDLYVGLQASWEADVWGRLSQLHEAARAQYLASVEGAKLVVTRLVADIGARYVELLALDRIDEIVLQSQQRQEQALEMMRLEKQAGRANELAVQQLAVQLSSTRTLRIENQQRIVELENELNLLVGRPPQAIARTRDLLDRPVPAAVSAGLPSALLQNRPDIKVAELELAATRADVAAARAAFFPRLTLSASVGYQAFDPRFLLRTPESIAYSLVGGLVAPLVNRRGIQAAFQAAEATQLQAMYSYQRAILTAYIEVVTGLKALSSAGESVAENQRKRDAAGGTVETADALFRAGKATYLDVLLAQQATLDAEVSLIHARRRQHLTLIGLYRALGGGWLGTLELD